MTVNLSPNTRRDVLVLCERLKSAITLIRANSPVDSGVVRISGSGPFSTLEIRADAIDFEFVLDTAIDALANYGDV